MNTFIIIMILMVLSNTGSTKGELTLTRGDQDIIEGITCEGTTLKNVPGFGCRCKTETNTFYGHEGKYCYSTIQIQNVEGCNTWTQINFEATFATCTLNKESVTAQIRDRNDEGESYWNDKYSDRLIEDLATIKDFQIILKASMTKLHSRGLLMKLSFKCANNGDPKCVIVKIEGKQTYPYVWEEPPPTTTTTTKTPTTTLEPNTTTTTEGKNTTITTSLVTSITTPSLPILSSISPSPSPSTSSHTSSIAQSSSTTETLTTILTSSSSPSTTTINTIFQTSSPITHTSSSIITTSRFIPQPSSSLTTSSITPTRSTPLDNVLPSSSTVQPNTTTIASQKPNAKGTSKGDDGSNTTIIAVVVAVCIILIVALVIFLVYRRMKKKNSVPYSYPSNDSQAYSNFYEASHNKDEKPVTSKTDSNKNSLSLDIQETSSQYQGIKNGELENYCPLDSAFSNEAYTGLDETDPKYYELETPKREEPVYNILEKEEDDTLYQDPNLPEAPVVPARDSQINTPAYNPSHQPSLDAVDGQTPYQEDYYSAALSPEPSQEDINALYAPVIKLRK